MPRQSLISGQSRAVQFTLKYNSLQGLGHELMLSAVLNVDTAFCCCFAPLIFVASNITSDLTIYIDCT